MKAPERDELLIRIDERTHNTYKLVEQINGTVDEHSKQITRNTTNIRWIVKILGVGVLLIGAGTGIAKVLGFI